MCVYMLRISFPKSASLDTTKIDYPSEIEKLIIHETEVIMTKKNNEKRKISAHKKSSLRLNWSSKKIIIKII